MTAPSSPVPAGTLRDEAVEAVGLALAEYLVPNYIGGWEGMSAKTQRLFRARAAQLLDLPAVARVVDEARADGWDEGWTAGDHDAAALAWEQQVGNSTDHLEVTANPYRAAVRQTDERNDR